jgi:hypothetical protein
LAYAGIPYQVLGERIGALALTIAWSRSAMARSAFGVSAIFASTALSPSALPARGAAARGRLQLLGALPHRVSFLIRDPLGFFLIAVVRLADFCVLPCGFPLSHCEVPPCVERVPAA